MNFFFKNDGREYACYFLIDEIFEYSRDAILCTAADSPNAVHRIEYTHERNML